MTMATLIPTTRMTENEDEGQLHTPTAHEMHDLMTE
ncbi:MAG: hypothetical protein QOH85_339, partial [Acidobacteriaceae bacterium]|nr:hypothetical protein [Acidobacteriaceae bacterium]